MKKNTFLTFALLLIFNSVNAQVLFSENFDSYAIGNFGTDFTGTTPTQSGWYTYQDPFVNGNSDYRIVAEPNRGNILYLGYANSILHNYLQVFRSDINTYWQQRIAGNNVFKISFDIFTKEANDLAANFIIENGLKEKLFHIAYEGAQRRVLLSTKTSGDWLKYNNGSLAILPVDTWVTIEVYIDYTNSDLYISIPTLNNYTAMFKMSTLQLGGIEHDDSPVKFLFAGYNGTRTIAGTNDQIDPEYDKPFRLRIDNINISAQNTVPTINLNINEFLSNQFNIYPNPAEDIIIITNSDNMSIQQINIYDLAGKLISTQNFNNEAEIQLNVETLTSGTYLLHIQTNESTAVKKLIRK